MKYQKIRIPNQKYRVLLLIVTNQLSSHLTSKSSCLSLADENISIVLLEIEKKLR